MSDLRVSIATTDYDHFRDFRIGVVRAAGIDAVWSLLGHHEIFDRFTAAREWDVAELSFAKFMAEATRNDSDIVGLPVVCSRLFRFGAIYVRRDRGIASPQDLAGKRVGSPEWAHTAAVWVRGWLQNDLGVDLTTVDWMQAGVNDPGRTEKVELALPPGLRVSPIADASLSEMLADGRLDAAIVARPPRCFLEGNADVVRLLPDHQQLEERYFADTHVWPIMHIIAVRRGLLETQPWVARNLFSAFAESKRRAVERLLDPAVSRYPLAWLPDHAARMRDVFGPDPFPFGIEANRPTLERMAVYAWQQGIAHRHPRLDEIFVTGLDTPVLV